MHCVQEKAEKYAEAYRCPATNESKYCKHDIISAYNNGYLEGQADIKPVLAVLGLKEINDGCSTGTNDFASGDIIESYSPVDGKLIAKVKTATKADYEKAMTAAEAAFLEWNNALIWPDQRHDWL
jgi:hypothetical protein